MLFARWHYHLRFAKGFAYAPFNAMVTKISKWSRIQDSCRIMSKIESLVVYAMPDIPSKFQKDLLITFWVILYTYRQTDRQTKSGKNITSLAEVKNSTINMLLLKCLVPAIYSLSHTLQRIMPTSPEIWLRKLSYRYKYNTTWQRARSCTADLTTNCCVLYVLKMC